MHPRERTTISCRCFARITCCALLLASLGVTPGSAQLLPVNGLPEKVRWSVAIAASPKGAPVIAGSVLVVPLDTGYASAHDLRDGTVRWMAEIDAVQSLASDAEHVYIASADALHALDAQTGRVAWRVATGAPPSAPPLARAGWVIATAAGDVLAIRAADGGVIWRRTVGHVDFRPTLDGDLLVLSVSDGPVVALDVRTGGERWARDLGTAPGEPLAIAGRVYLGTAGKLFYSLDASNGRPDWRWKIGAVPRGQTAVDDKHVYFVALDNVLRAIDRGHGGLKWWKGLTYRPASGPVLLGKFVVVPGYVASLPAFLAETGTAAGEVRFAAALATLPILSRSPSGAPLAFGIVGDLERPWTLTMLEASMVPVLAPVGLAELPGELVPMPSPPDR